MFLQKGFEPILGLVAPPQARASIHTLMNKYPIFWKSTTLGCIEVKRTACQLCCRPNGLLLGNYSLKIWKKAFGGLLTYLFLDESITIEPSIF